MADILHKTHDLSDEVFEELTASIGYRAALLVLRHKAISGDVRAIELYIKLTKEQKAERARTKKAMPPSRDVSRADVWTKPKRLSTTDSAPDRSVGTDKPADLADK